MVDNTSTNFPNSKTKFTTDEGILTKEASVLLRALWNRTGGGTGGDLAAVRATADAALASATASLKKVSNLGDLTLPATARTNLGLGSVALGNTVAGWTNPTGAGSRATFDANWTTVVSNPPTQSEVGNVRDQLVIVQKRLAQLILDAETAKVISN